jgi:hypothetical protein
MPRSRKTPAPLEPESPHATEHAFIRALETPASPGLTSPAGVMTALPGDTQMQVDVHVCLLDAMTDNFPIRRSEIGAKTVPSKPPIGADAQGWGLCLAGFGEYLHQLRPVYAFYVHKPRYTEETIDEPFPAIVLYLKQKILAQFGGEDE